MTILFLGVKIMKTTFPFCFQEQVTPKSSELSLSATGEGFFLLESDKNHVMLWKVSPTNGCLE